MLKILHIAYVFGCILALTVIADAAFYRYRDANNRTVFVDDLAKVPEAFRDRVRVYPEAADTMTDSQRRTRDVEETRQQMRLRQRYLQHVRKIEAKSAKKEASKKAPPASTSIRVTNNQVLVPVKLGYGGVETETVLLLDTGANVTTIHREVADALGLRWPKRASMQVVGGHRIQAGLATLGYITLGTIRIEGIDVGIVAHQGAKLPYAGFLGMNVLRQVGFQVDMKNEMITWKPRADRPKPP